VREVTIANGKAEGLVPVTPERDDPAEVRGAEAELNVAVRDEAALTEAGRRFFGVVGRGERLPFEAVLNASGARWYEAGSLWALAFADALAGAAIMTETAAIHLHLSSGALGPLTVLRPLVFFAGGVLGVTVLRRRASRPLSARAAALASGAGLLSVGLSTSTTAMFVAALVVALASGTLASVLLPMLFDAYRPELRVRLVGGYAAALVLGMGSASLIAKVADGLGVTWRGAILVMALAPLSASAIALRLTDPQPGRWDRNRISRLVEARLGGRGEHAGELGSADVGLSLGRQFRLVVAFKSSGALLISAILFGVIAWGFQPAVEVFLRDRWGMVAPSRELLIAMLILSVAPGVLWFASKAEQVYRISPRHLLQTASSVTLLSGLCLSLATVAPVFWLTVLFLWLSFSGFAALLVVSVFLLVTLCDPALRGHAAVLLGAILVAGGPVGPQIVGTIASRFGIEWGLVAFAFLLPLPAALLLGRSAEVVESDVDRLVGHIVEADDLATRVSLGHHLPLLSCHGINFSYGQVQVLFDVSLTVDEAEMVALLGTNGAGKSTLLRLISGLDFPSAGSIHYRGADVTFVDSERRVELGISQIPGGRAVFGPLTVIDNLRAYGFSLGRDRSRLERGIDEAFAALPRLAERRDQLASTLSGGERQMLALAKSYLLRPRLLLIDELSLGLAPKVVGELLEMVRQLNDAGTAVVLVEQSVNVALSVVDHAYFMEKGEMRFDGVAGDLLERPDLLRSVFLQGATKGLKAATGR
jgi:ABC-type branched-subunit amino acid transport system ATPase component